MTGGLNGWGSAVSVFAAVPLPTLGFSLSSLSLGEEKPLNMQDYVVYACASACAAARARRPKIAKNRGNPTVGFISREPHGERRRTAQEIET